MGNEPSDQSMSSWWSGSVWFGNGHRDVSFFDEHFGIPGKIVNVAEIVRNEIVVVVNKVKWYGLRLIICDKRSCGNTQPKKSDFEVLKLTDVWGIAEKDVDTHINDIKYYFTNPKYCDAPWTILEQSYKGITSKLPPWRVVKLKLRVDEDGKASTKGRLCELQRQSVIESLIPGDILIINTTHIYYHYAIYIGDGYVVNIDNKSNQGGAIKESFGSACGGSTIWVMVEYKLIEMTPRSSIVSKAKESADKNEYKGAYNLIVQNCEHFARGLVEAGPEKIEQSDFKPQGRCKQVQTYATGLTIGGTILSGIVHAALK